MILQREQLQSGWFCSFFSGRSKPLYKLNPITSLLHACPAPKCTRGGKLQRSEQFPALGSYFRTFWHTTEPADARPRELQAGRHAGQRREQPEWRWRRQHRRPVPVFHHSFPTLANHAGTEFHLEQSTVTLRLIVYVMRCSMPWRCSISPGGSRIWHSVTQLRLNE